MEKVIKVNLDLTETNLFKAEPFKPDETFWTTDVNSAFLEFETVQTVTGATASLVLTNAEDGAVVQRNIDLTDPIFRYMMREKEIAHAGHWYGQIVVKEEGRFITATEFRFQVRGTILDGSDDRLFDADNYNKLADQLFTLYEHLNAFLLDVKVSEQLRENAELLRASVFESSQNARAQAFLVSENDRSKRFGLSEAERDDQEEARQEAEALRRSVFDAAQAERTQDFLDAESARTSLFNAAETLRQEAENQRSIDEDAREVSEGLRTEVFETNEALRHQGEVLRENAEGIRATNEEDREQTFGTYDGRITTLESDYAVLATNIIKNGDFSNGITDWILHYSATTNLEGNTLKVSTASTGYSGVRQTRKAVANNIYYIRLTIRQDTGSLKNINVQTTAASSLHSIQSGVETTISKIYKSTEDYPISITKDSSADVFDFYVSYVMNIDLTATFGVGNEPTTAQMDRLLTQFPNTWFDGTQNLFLARWALNELFRQDRDKANNKQEDWITPTLLNGWVAGGSGVKYRKNSFGRVELEISIQNGTSGLMFVLPVGYRPIVTTDIVANSGDGFGNLRIETNGNVTRRIGSGSYVLSFGQSFPIS